MDYAEQRKRRIDLLTTRLHEALVLPDNGEHLARTGSLLKSKSLRTQKSKASFKVILSAMQDDYDPERASQTRFWSRALIKDALHNLVKRFQLELPKLPGFSWSSWVNTQAEILHSLCKRAQRNAKYVGKVPAQDMDHEDTQPMWGAEAGLFIMSIYILFEPLSRNLQYTCVAGWGACSRGGCIQNCNRCFAARRPGQAAHLRGCVMS